MKIKDYPLVVNVTEDDVLLIDGPNGTRTIKAADISRVVSQNHRTFRGKDLGSELTAEQKASIADGSFTDLYLGDYWTFGEQKWRIVDFDYFYGAGDTTCTTHHVVVMPDTYLLTGALHTGSTNAALGYNKFSSHTNGVLRNNVVENSPFALSDILGHRERFAIVDVTNNTVDSVWSDAYVEVPAMLQVFGWNLGERDTTCIRQFDLFAKHPEYIFINGKSFWTRDVVTANAAMAMTYYGCLTKDAINVTNYGLRPYLAIC